MALTEEEMNTIMDLLTRCSFRNFKFIEEMCSSYRDKLEMKCDTERDGTKC